MSNQQEHDEYCAELNGQSFRARRPPGRQPGLFWANRRHQVRLGNAHFTRVADTDNVIAIFEATKAAIAPRLEIGGKGDAFAAGCRVSSDGLVPETRAMVDREGHNW